MPFSRGPAQRAAAILRYLLEHDSDPAASRAAYSNAELACGTGMSDPRISDELLKQYLRPWYAAHSITIYRDIKTMALELLNHRHAACYAAGALSRATANPLMPAEAQAMRAQTEKPM